MIGKRSRDAAVMCERDWTMRQQACYSLGCVHAHSCSSKAPRCYRAAAKNTKLRKYKIYVCGWFLVLRVVSAGGARRDGRCEEFETQCALQRERLAQTDFQVLDSVQVGVKNVMSACLTDISRVSRARIPITISFIVERSSACHVTKFERCLS